MDLFKKKEKIPPQDSEVGGEKGDQKAEGNPKKSKEVGKLHNGDYTVHVFIESIKEIDVAADDSIEIVTAVTC